MSNIKTNPAPETGPDKPFPVKYKTGLTEMKVFGSLSITERHEFVDLLCSGKTPELVACGARQSIAWINSLDEDCYLDLSQKFIRENFSYAVKMATKDMVTALRVGPLIAQMGDLLQLRTSMSYALMQDPGIATGTTLQGEAGPEAAKEVPGTESSATPPNDSKAS